MLNLEDHRLVLAIAKKTLDENHFRTVQKTTDRQPPSFQIGDRVYFKKQTAWQMGPQMETWIQNCLNGAQWALPTHRKPGNWKSMILQHEGCSSQASYRNLEYRYPDGQSWKICQPSCEFTYYISS